jgi:uncharacterized protein (DUF1778 family)
MYVKLPYSYHRKYRTMQHTASERLDIRISAKHKRLIESAARATGQSVSQFVTTQAVSAAEKALEAEQVRTLSERDRKAFLRILDRTEPNKALKAAAAHFMTRYAR